MIRDSVICEVDVSKSMSYAIIQWEIPLVGLPSITYPSAASRKLRRLMVRWYTGRTYIARDKNVAAIARRGASSE